MCVAVTHLFFFLLLRHFILFEFFCCCPFGKGGILILCNAKCTANKKKTISHFTFDKGAIKIRISFQVNAYFVYVCLCLGFWRMLKCQAIYCVGLFDTFVFSIITCACHLLLSLKRFFFRTYLTILLVDKLIYATLIEPSTTATERMHGSTHQTKNEANAGKSETLTNETSKNDCKIIHTRCRLIK